jgi:uncharacterized protein (TIRG00374 family)
VSRRRIVIGLVVGLPVSAAFLWLAVRNADLATVRATLEEARRELVLLAVVALMAVNAIQAARWRKIAAVRTVGWWRFYEMVVSGVACNNVLPARLGDFFRARWLATSARMPTGRAFGTVVIDRACDLVALLFLLVIGLAAVATSVWIVSIAAGTLIALLGVAAAVVFARLYTSRRARERRARGTVRRLVRDTAEALAEPMGRKGPVIWFALSLLAWTSWALAAMLIARSLGFDLDLIDALFVAAIMNLGVAIPSSPGFVGTYEWLGVAALGLLGIPSEQALAFSILIHASWYVPTTLAGGGAIVVRAGARVRRTRGVRARGSAQASAGPAGRRAP